MPLGQRGQSRCWQPGANAEPTNWKEAKVALPKADARALRMCVFYVVPATCTHGPLQPPLCREHASGPAPWPHAGGRGTLVRSPRTLPSSCQPPRQMSTAQNAPQPGDGGK